MLQQLIDDDVRIAQLLGRLQQWNEADSRCPRGCVHQACLACQHHGGQDVVGTSSHGHNDGFNGSGSVGIE